MSFLELKQDVKLTQQLVMTPQLQQAIKLLQLSRLELVETVQQEIEQNPVLEEVAQDQESGQDREECEAEGQEEGAAPENIDAMNLEKSYVSEINWADYVNEYEGGGGNYNRKRQTGGEEPSRLDIISKKPDLNSHLHWQLCHSNISEDELEVALFILGNLDNKGFLKVEEEEICEAVGCDRATARKMTDLIQDMDPPGVAARNVKESLLLQLKRLNLEDSLPYRIVRDHLRYLETKNYDAIVRATRESMDNVIAAVNIILDLDPHPGAAFSDEEPHYIIPDVYIQKIGDEYVIILNDEGLPKLKISSYYRELLKEREEASDAARDYIKEKLRSASWLIKSIQQRQRTIYQVVESIIKHQRNFLEHGVGALRPMVLRDIAEDIDMHESTISRVTSNKYVHIPQGAFELKYFFSSAIKKRGSEDLSSTSIKERIRSLLHDENLDKPLSDQAISEIFQEQGIKVARRTVAKYREQLGILSSKYRKRHRK
ncbi:MAG: RNA polymerase factor sigma-54 [Thermodesulfobacteriota bacterium]